MTADELKQYHIRKTNEWRAANPERTREIDAKASKKYYHKKRDTDPEFIERKRASGRESMRKFRASMTDEEREEFKRKERERIAAYRARKKAEKLALEAAAKAKEGKTE